MTNVKILSRSVPALAAVAAIGGFLTAAAQVKTSVPDPVPGAPPAIVERIKIHGKALEGNLHHGRACLINDATLMRLPSSEVGAVAHSGRTRMLSVCLRLGDRQRRCSVSAASAKGWEVVRQEDQELVTRTRYHDWHRVERSIALFDREINELLAQGWKVQSTKP